MKTPAQQNYDLYQTQVAGRPAPVIKKQEGLSGLEIAGIVGGSLALLGAGAYGVYQTNNSGSFGSVVTNGYDKDENPFVASARRQTSDRQIANAPPKAQRVLGTSIQMDSMYK